MRLLHTTIPYTASASGSLPNYPASNLQTPEVEKPWRHSDILGSAWIQAQRSGSSAMHLALQSVEAGIPQQVSAGSASASTPVGTFAGAMHQDASRRSKGNIAVPTPNTFVRVSMSGLQNFGVGALYLFATELQLPDALLRSEITTEYPQASVKLPNGTEFPVDRGPPRTRITLRWRRPRADDIEEVARIARAGICWLDLQNPDQPGWQWPVRCISATLPRQLTHALQDEATLEFVEVV